MSNILIKLVLEGRGIGLVKCLKKKCLVIRGCPPSPHYYISPRFFSCKKFEFLGGLFVIAHSTPVAVLKRKTGNATCCVFGDGLKNEIFFGILLLYCIIIPIAAGILTFQSWIQCQEQGFLTFWICAFFFFMENNNNNTHTYLGYTLLEAHLRFFRIDLII